MTVDWELIKAIRAALKADKDIPKDKIEALCRTIEEQDKDIGQKTQEYASLTRHNADLDERLGNHATLNATLLAKIEELGRAPAPVSDAAT